MARTFEGCPPGYHAAYAEIIGHLRSLGAVHEDAVQVGVFLKTDRKLAEIRPKPRSLELCLYLPRRIQHARISRHIPISADRTVNIVKLHTADDVDEQVLDWLTEAHLDATDR
ncbi:MAG: hypothetical protein QOH68_1159 [Nocardioidaceae bacterium]|nr:hypothetical protein [Nocardioidaceae bacterium]